MAQYFEIPLSPSPQRFNITLSGIEYQLTLAYRNSNQGGWVLDIADKQGVVIVAGIPLVTGADLLAQYRHLGFAGRLWCQGTIVSEDVPTFDNLGTESLLIWVTE